jgi:hypothetical protein
MLLISLLPLPYQMLLQPYSECALLHLIALQAAFNRSNCRLVCLHDISMPLQGSVDKANTHMSIAFFEKHSAVTCSLLAVRAPVGAWY